MLKVRVIPILLFKSPESGLVKSVNFTNLRTVGNPINAARVYNSRNVDELVFLDIGARRDSRTIDSVTVKKILDECFMPVTIGGKIETMADVRKMLLIGADKVSINTSGLNTPGLISQIANSYGSQCLVISIDAKKVDGRYQVFSEAGQKNTGLEVIQWARKAESLGAGEILITSIDKEGGMEGFDIELIAKVSSAVNIPVIAHGGAGNPQHVIDAIKIGNASAIAAASIFHFTHWTPMMVKQEMKQAGISVRL